MILAGAVGASFASVLTGALAVGLGACCCAVAAQAASAKLPKTAQTRACNFKARISFNFLKQVVRSGNLTLSVSITLIIN
jgi:hypothetical protein